MTAPREILWHRHEVKSRRLAEFFAAGRISEDQFCAATGALGEELQKQLDQLEAEPVTPKRPPRMQRPAPELSPYYSTTPEHMTRDPRMTPSARRLVEQLVRLSRGRQSCDAYVDQLADMLGVTGRTIQRAQRVAEACGYIQVEHVREGRVNDANVYHLLDRCRPKGRPEPKKRAKERNRPEAGQGRGRRRRASQRPAKSPMGVTGMSPHEERNLKVPSPPAVPPEGDNRSAARRDACGVAAAHVTAAPLASIVRRIEAWQGERVAKSMPKTGPP